MTTPATLFAEARAAKRAALDELAGKQLLASFGISVPRSLVIQDAGAVAVSYPGFTRDLARLTT